MEIDVLTHDTPGDTTLSPDIITEKNISISSDGKICFLLLLSYSVPYLTQFLRIV
jgi:hypothetical protein